MGCLQQFLKKMKMSILYCIYSFYLVSINLVVVLVSVGGWWVGGWLVPSPPIAMYIYIS
jgi:hypothetical protein